MWGAHNLHLWMKREEDAARAAAARLRRHRFLPRRSSQVAVVLDPGSTLLEEPALAEDSPGAVGVAGTLSTDQDPIFLDQARPEASLTAALGRASRLLRPWFSLPGVRKTAKRREVVPRASARRKSQAFCERFARPSHRGSYDLSKPA